jgi:hypothetical protein
MNRLNSRWPMLLAAGAILLSGCGGATARAGTTPAAAPAAGSTMSPGMVMPDGSTMGAEAASPTATAGEPPALAAMVCDAEVRGDITEVLSLPAAPATSSTWTDHLYTCTYQLPVGPLVLSVKESATAAAAYDYYLASRKQIGTTRDVAGLGRHAYRTTAGTVGLVKDNFTLTVDATGLPAQFGNQEQKRTDLAYEVASVVLGCWTGDE